MIFCEKLLFLHVPKTAGSSLAQVLLERLPRPTYYSHPDASSSDPSNGIVHIPGGSHENLAEARDIIAVHGFDLADIDVILGVVRNPYDMEVSRYFYLRTANPYDIGYNQALALTSDFETFAVKSKPHGWLRRPIESYFTIGGEIPSNMHILRMESLLEGLNRALAAAGLPAVDSLPTANASNHNEYIRYYTPRAEQAVFDRYRWLFDEGFYERLDASELRGGKEALSTSAVPPVSDATRMSPAELAAPLIVLAHEADVDTRARIVGAMLADLDEERQAEVLGALSLSAGLIAALAHGANDMEKTRVAGSLMFGAGEEAKRQLVSALLHNATPEALRSAVESVFYGVDEQTRGEVAMALLGGTTEESRARLLATARLDP